MGGGGITSGVPAAGFSPATILARLLTVDGTGSGLDADKVRGTTPGASGLLLLALGALGSEGQVPLVSGSGIVWGSVDSITSGAVADAVELEVANIDDPSAELNAIGTAEPDWRLCFQDYSGAAEQSTLYRLQACSDADNPPYVVDSLTGGLKWVAITGRYSISNFTSLGAVNCAGVYSSVGVDSVGDILSNSRVIAKPAGTAGISLDPNAATGDFTMRLSPANLTANRRFTLGDADLSITGGGTLALAGFTLTVPATGTVGLINTTNTWALAQTFTVAPVMSALTASRLVRTDSSKNLESNAALTGTHVLFADANGWPSGSASLTWNGTAFSVGNGSSGNQLTVNHLLSQVAIQTYGDSLPASGGRIGFSFSGGATTNNLNRYAITAYALENWVSGGASGCEMRFEVAAIGASSRTTAATVSSTAFSIPGTFNVTTAASRYAFNVSGAYLSWIECDGTSGSNYMRFGVANNEWLRITNTGVTSFSNTTDATSSTAAGVALASGLAVAKGTYFGTFALSVSPTAGIGYATGAGGTVTQGTSRATGVTLNKVCGQITLVSAAGSTSWTSFTVTNSAVASTDVVRVCQDSGTDKYQIHVTAVGAGSFEITFATTGGTTTEQPVFSFAVIKAVTS